MRRRQLALHLFKQKPTAALDECSYTLYLAALLTALFQLIDTQSFSPALAQIFTEFKFWELQVKGALELNDAIGVSATKDRITEKLRESPTWLICRLLPSVQSVTASKIW